MCGRSACSRSPEGVQCACAYKNKGKDGSTTKPQWLDTGQKYYPSYNICPQSNSPVLLSSQQSHLASSAQKLDTTRVLQVMKWGLVPSWHQGEPGKFPTLLNNCRFEGMLEKPSFRPATQKRQRCVVLADGFYEWDRKSGRKQPYFIHWSDTRPSPEMLELASQTSDQPVQAECKTSNIEGFSEVAKGKLLTMAGLFDTCKSTTDDAETLYTYTIITLDSHPSFGHIHDRMPALLHNDDAIERWLDPSIPTTELMSMLQPSAALSWYPVSTAVNNVKHKSSECVEKIDPRKQVSKNQATIFSFFKSSPQKSTTDAPEPSPSDTKKPKLGN